MGLTNLGFIRYLYEAWDNNPKIRVAIFQESREMIIDLVVHKGMKHREVADIVGVSKSAVTSIVKRHN